MQPSDSACPAVRQGPLYPSDERDRSGITTGHLGPYPACKDRPRKSRIPGDSSRCLCRPPCPSSSVPAAEVRLQPPLSDDLRVHGLKTKTQGPGGRGCIDVVGETPPSEGGIPPDLPRAHSLIAPVVDLTASSSRTGSALWPGGQQRLPPKICSGRTGLHYLYFPLVPMICRGPSVPRGAILHSMRWFPKTCMRLP